MERALSDYEKIKKAEEIYNRRKMMGVGGVRVASPTIDKSPKKELNSVKKMVLQICICIVLYFIVYLVQNSNYIFSEQFMNKTRELLTYDMNFKEHITQIINNIEENTKWFSILPMQNETQNDGNVNTDATDNTNSNTNTNPENNITNAVNEIPAAVGGSEPQNIINEVAKKDEESKKEEPKKTQMEIDADNVKKNYSLGLPLKGTITSPYGERDVAPKFHVGLDIGANTGTDIVSAMDGVATLVSTTGDYGKHIKITSGNLVTLYAHCSKLNIKEGQKIKKGEKIAEVGETGNATGPHLHFEIILERKVCWSAVGYEMVEEAICK